MNPPTLPQRRTLRDRRTNERMPETKRLQIDIDDARLDGWANHVNAQICSDHRAAGRKDRAHSVRVVEGGNQQHETSCHRQV
jgi:hypothetical protein